MYARSFPATDARTPSVIVGIGASAGGLEVIERLLGDFPAQTGLSLIVTQHRSAVHSRSLVDLLAPKTDLEVVEPEDGEPLRPGCAYVAPPDAALVLEEGRFRRVQPLRWRSVEHPIDQLFRSLADEYGSRAAGVLLTGRGTDGGVGLRELRAEGGVTVVQRPDTAVHPGMPRAALDAGAAELVLPPEEIPPVLARLARDPDRSAPPPEEGRGAGPESERVDVVREVVGLLRTREHFDAGQYKEGTLRRRIFRRAGLQGVASTARYLEDLRGSAEERHCLIRDLVVGVTEFFRDPEAFEQLERQTIRALVERAAPGDTLRFWVPACSTGEEAYSLAILALEAIGREGRDLGLQVFATDVDPDAVNLARRGVYPAGIIAQVAPDRLERFFSPHERGFAVHRAVRDCLSFAAHDLTRDPPLSRMHLVSCRNLLIYLRPEAQERVFQMVHFALQDGGYLFLGSSESLGSMEERFEPVSSKWRIYRRAGRALSRLPTPPLLSARREGAPRAVAPAAPGRRKDVARSGTERAQLSLLKARVPPSLVVSDDLRVLYVHGDVGRWTRIPEGEIRRDLLAILREDLRTRVRTALHRCRRDRAAIEVPSGSPHEPLRIEISPALDSAQDGPAFVISFEEISGEAGAETDGEAEPEPGGAREQLIEQLERELSATREDLRSSVEELESSNEELRAANEESVSMNEELQAANEELEATTEELRTLNEELATVNVQRKEKIEELERAHDDLDNFFASTRLATLFFDSGLRLKRFTPAASRLLQLEEGDVGRPLQRFSSDLMAGDLARECRQVLEDLVPLERELQVEGDRWFLREILPYRTKARRIEGVVLTLQEITDRKRGERSAARIAAIVESSDDAIFSYDLSEGILTWNRGAERLYGYAAEEAIGRPFGALFAGADAAELLARVRRGEVIDKHQSRHLRKDGRAVEVAVTMSPICDASGAVVSGSAVARDITERKRYLDAVARMAALVEYSDDAILSIDREGVVRSWNRGARELYGYGERDGVGRPFAVLFPQEKHQEVERLLEALFRGEAVERYETVQVASDGSRIPVAMTLSPVRGEGGAVTAVSAVLRDVSAQKRAKEALKAAEERYRRTIEQSPVAMALDAGGEMLLLNETWRSVTGYGVRDMPRFEDWLRLLQRECAGEVRERIEEAERAGSVFESELEIYTGDGGVRTMVVRSALVGRSGDGRPLRCTAATDVTEQRRHERALEDASRQKDEFLAMLGHELRNPLAAIRNAVQLQQVVELDHPRLKFTRESIERQTRQMARLLDDLLDVSRIVRRKIELVEQRLDLCELVRDAVNDNCHSADAEEVELEVRLQEAPVWVDGDPTRLSQVVGNLLGNAIKFTEGPGQVTVTVDRRGGEAVLEVEDGGCGIEPDLLPHVFEPFRQAKQGLARTTGGLGLGLALVRGLVELHGGSVEAHSDGAGEGARFVVQLPLAPAPPAAEEAPEREARGDFRILVVEDNRDAADLLCALLEELGQEVACAGSGEEAIGLARSFAPDVVLCDVGLPGKMSGFDVARALRREALVRPEGLIALSGYGRKGDRERALEAGFAEFLRKPVDLDAIERVLGAGGRDLS